MDEVTQETAAQFLLYNHNTDNPRLQPQYTDNPQSMCEGFITNALQTCSKEFSLLMQTGDSLTDALRIVSVLSLTVQLAFGGCLM